MAKDDETGGLDVWDVALIAGLGTVGGVGGQKLVKKLMGKGARDRALAAKKHLSRPHRSEDRVETHRVTDQKGRVWRKTEPKDPNARAYNDETERLTEPYYDYYTKLGYGAIGGGAVGAASGTFAAAERKRRPRK